MTDNSSKVGLVVVVDIEALQKARRKVVLSKYWYVWNQLPKTTQVIFDLTNLLEVESSMSFWN